MVALAGCATTPEDRIAAHRADFASWPAEVQSMVRAGQAGIGFTQEQVLVALGEPEIRTVAGVPPQLTEVWVYRRRAPRLSIGIGFGSVGRSSAVGGDVAANGIKLGQDMNGRIIFMNGRVSEITIDVR